MRTPFVITFFVVTGYLFALIVAIGFFHYGFGLLKVDSALRDTSTLLGERISFSTADYFFRASVFATGIVTAGFIIATVHLIAFIAEGMTRFRDSHESLGSTGFSWDR